MYSGIHAVAFTTAALVVVGAISVVLHALWGRNRRRFVNSMWRVIVLAACLGTTLGLLLNLLFVLGGFTKRKFGQWCYATFHVDDGSGLVHLMAFVVPITISTSLFTIHLYRKWYTNDAANCRRCSYDLTGNESGVCPECGTPIKDTVQPSR